MMMKKKKNLGQANFAELLSIPREARQVFFEAKIE